MPNSDLLPYLLYKTNENQLALEAVLYRSSSGGRVTSPTKFVAPWLQSTETKSSSNGLSQC
ncbi:hypothetical protein F475_05810 [Pseudomonas sp. URMO17WK12:I6]|jgi:flagellin-like hook-associated protein FlgL|nr:hypothetical protein F475_05810 [Pseudomonas sp. URMO17WK12:I6]